jgi:hypothetical protein
LGTVTCPRHGRASLAFACPHLRAVRFPLSVGGVRVQLLVRAEGVDEVCLEYAVCQPCAVAIGTHEGERSFDQVEERLNAVAGDPECASCEREDRWEREQMPVAHVFVPG